VDHEVAYLLAGLVVLLSEHFLTDERALGGHKVLQEAQGDTLEELGLVETQILCLRGIHHELVDPLCRHLELEEVVVDDRGVDVLRVDLLAECGAPQHPLEFAGQRD